MGTHITVVMTESGEPLGEWETEHPIRSGDVIVDEGVEWKALFVRHVPCSFASRSVASHGYSTLVVRSHR
ncbi:MAG: hypothetical protein Unbinned2691contig1000_55 [Prokaryotic dsDNA virus sp.]|nr:MAG: hypothetical protein Unbinned2691contig1000_55 [Prokaryotic dsDNA virus sp.]